MAIKAGLVGVNPNGVDNSDMPIASKFKAGDKTYKFASDDNGAIGYIDSDGVFHPFSGAGVIGFNIPNATITGLSMKEVIDEQSVDLDFDATGGYEVSDGMVYVDITLAFTPQSNNVFIYGFPPALGDNWRYMQRSSLNATGNMGIDTLAFKKDATSNTMYGEFAVVANRENTIRISGMYIHE